MPRNRFTKVLLPLGLIAVALHAVFRRGDNWEFEDELDEPETPATAPADEAAATPERRRRSAPARAAVAAAFTTIFFAGAAFTAGAGDQAAQLLEGDQAALEAATTSTEADAEAEAAEAAETAAAETEPAAAETEPAPAEPAPAEPAPAAPAPAEPAPAEAAPAEAAPAAPAPAAPAPAAAAPAEPAPAQPAPAAAPAAAGESAPATGAAAQSASSEPAAAPEAPAAAPAAAAPAPAPAAKAPAAAPAREPAAARKAAAQPAPAPAAAKRSVVVPATPAAEPEIEEEHGDHPTIWLNRELPDPTPPSARLSKRFAKGLRAAAKRHKADWALVLAVLRAQDRRGAAPATAAELDALADRVAGRDAWKAALALSGKTAFADEVEALRDLYRSVGLQTLVEGYEKSKRRLAKRLLDRDGVWVYAGGRSDLEAGRIDVRVIALLGFLAQRYETITVSSLFSGHRMFSRPGVVSAHMYGHAVDIAALGGTPIFGNSLPGGLTEDAVRSILLLPSELQPRQVISLLGLGGPSFPMRDHADHIHVGY